MMIHAWRITKNKHADSAFTGIGAKLYGGRWSSPGVPLVYAAGTASLAMLEMLVHLQAQELINRYVLFEVTFDDSLVATIQPADLPRSWKQAPPTPSLQRIGDEWAAGRTTAVLRVPSVIVPKEWNYLINPSHPDFPKIQIGRKQPLQFDPRLIKK